MFFNSGRQIMGNISKLVLSASIMLALAFTFNCSSGSDDNNGGGGGGSSSPSGGGVPFNENSQVYFRDGTPYIGNSIIEIHGTPLNAGSITNGIVNLQLPTTIPNEYLEDFMEGCNPNNIKGFEPDFVITGGKHFLPESFQPHQEIHYTYFSKAGKIVCSGEDYEINIDAKAGWNTIYLVVSGDTEKWSTNNILTKEVRWQFIGE